MYFGNYGGCLSSFWFELQVSLKAVTALSWRKNFESERFSEICQEKLMLFSSNFLFQFSKVRSKKNDKQNFLPSFLSQFEKDKTLFALFRKWQIRELFCFFKRQKKASILQKRHRNLSWSWFYWENFLGNTWISLKLLYGRVCLYDGLSSRKNGKTISDLFKKKERRKKLVLGPVNLGRGLTGMNVLENTQLFPSQREIVFFLFLHEKLACFSKGSMQKIK